MRILITGGAGFIGSSLAKAFKNENPNCTVVAFDNLKRRGSELNLPVLKNLGIEFVHGDIRNASDLDDLEGNFDLFVEASAEPSVMAGLQGSPRYLLGTNLSGTLNCLEFARLRAPRFIFLSTSRVYPIGPLRALKLRETETRFELDAAQSMPGVTAKGIAENFPLDGPRSLYGSTKLASELIVQEYAHNYGMHAVINRCGVVAGPGQFGKVDQGVFTLWMIHHVFKKPLKYTGFGGTGKQVRDLLAPDDLFELIKIESANLEKYSGRVFNASGGREISISLAELTRQCQEISGNTVPLTPIFETSTVDVPYCVLDSTRALEELGWKPHRSVRGILTDIHEWLRVNQTTLTSLFA